MIKFLIAILMFGLGFYTGNYKKNTPIKHWEDVNDYIGESLFGGKVYGVIQRCKETGEYRDNRIIK